MEINQSTKTFAHLPLEAKHEIFSYLDYKSLKTATLVSKSWNDAISSLKEFNTKTRLDLCIYREEKLKFKKFWRSYQNVKLCAAEEKTVLLMLNAIKSFSTHLSSLKVRFIGMPSKKVKSALLDLLQQCSQLTSLNIKNSFGDNKKTANPKQIVRLASLKQLKILKSNWIVDSIECTTLQKLYIKHELGSEESIAKFISTQTELVSLTGVYFNLETEHEILPKFQLSEIKVEHLTSDDPSRPIQNMKNLIQAAASGASLDLCCDQIPELFHQIMAFISDLANINHLCIRIEDLINSEIQRMDYGNFDHIKSLKIGIYDEEFCSDNAEFIQRFLMKFLKVESIEIEDTDLDTMFARYDLSEDVLIPIFAKLPSLKKLKMPMESFEQICSRRIPVLPHIETIAIPSCISDNFLTCQKGIKFFGKRHETIRHVSIELADELMRSATSIGKIKKALLQGFPSAQTFEVQHCMGKKKLIFNRQEMRQGANE